jgi:hypothetical protein
VREPPFCPAKNSIYAPRERQRLDAKTIWRLITKTIASALLGLTVLTGVAVAPASAAWDTKAFWENLERTQGGGGN